jgi:hypothetical protein
VPVSIQATFPGRGYPLAGFHGTFPQHVESIVEEGYIRDGEWGVFFWHSNASGDTSPQTMYNMFTRCLSREPVRPIMVEVSSSCGYGKVSEGGHAEEAASCAIHGCNRYKQGRNVLRTTALSTACTLRAIWVPLGADLRCLQGYAVVQPVP